MRLVCPACERPARLEWSGPVTWQCPGCDHLVRLLAAPAADLAACGVCGNRELYKKKDFPQWLGVGVLTAACVAFLLCSLLYHQWVGWAILIGSAAFDGVLYLYVKDVIVCYRCGTEFRGCSPAGGHEPYELGIAERYRQERLRREQMRAEKKEA